MTPTAVQIAIERNMNLCLAFIQQDFKNYLEKVAPDEIRPTEVDLPLWVTRLLRVAVDTLGTKEPKQLSLVESMVGTICSLDYLQQFNWKAFYLGRKGNVQRVPEAGRLTRYVFWRGEPIKEGDEIRADKANCELLELTTELVMHTVHRKLYDYTSKVAPNRPSPLRGNGGIKAEWILEIRRYMHREALPIEYTRAHCTNVSAYLNVLHTEDFYSQFAWNPNLDSSSYKQ